MASDLTYGTEEIYCGNLARGLRRRNMAQVRRQNACTLSHTSGTRMGKDWVRWVVGLTEWWGGGVQAAEKYEQAGDGQDGPTNPEMSQDEIMEVRRVLLVCAQALLWRAPQHCSCLARGMGKGWAGA